MTPVLFSLLLLGAQTDTAQDGGVALVVNIPDEGAALRAVAAGVVAGAKEQWAVLNPPIKPEEVEACGAVDVCLNKLAQERGASHLFIIGVASLGEGEVVVSLQMFDSLGADLLSFTDVLVIGGDPTAAGKRLMLEQTAELTDLPAPGSAEEKWPAPPEPIVKTYSGLGLLSISGWALVGVGGTVAVAAVTFGALQTMHAIPGLSPDTRNITALVATPVVIALVGAGLGLASADLFLQ